MKLADELRKIVNRSLCDEEDVYLSFLKKIEEGNLIRDENEESHFCVYFLPYNPDTQEIFIGHHKKSSLWLSPGGHIEKGETLLDTLVREIKEELGLDFDIEKIDTPFMISLTEIDNHPQLCRAHYDVWYLTPIDGGKFNLNSREFHETKWVTVNQARKLVTDPNTIKALDLLEKQPLYEMEKLVLLIQKWTTEVKPKPPFNFDGSIYHPAHFPTPTEEYQPGKWWQTMRFQEKPLGIKMENQGTTNKPKIKLTVYSQEPLSLDFKKHLVEEIKYRFEFNLDLSEFNKKFKNDKVLGPVIKKWLGRRSKCGYSLYESLMIYIVLQNATVRRTIQMMNALLEKYGNKVRFDRKEFWVMWSSEKLARASEKELRDLKVGYRAKSLKRISESFAQREFDEKKLRQKSPEEIKDKLIKLYGIGPNSASYILFEVFHNHEVFDILPPWEQKIYSRLLYNERLVPAQKILADIDKRWGKWKRLAADYVWHDLFWRHEQKPINWLEKEIRR